MISRYFLRSSVAYDRVRSNSFSQPRAKILFSFAYLLVC
jgi:hypothetical protein